ELAPKQYITLNTVDAELLGLHAGESINVTLGEETHELPCAVRPDLPRGVACLPAGLTPFEGHALPARGRLAVARAAISMRGSR
ncbi:MAG: NADH-quinone oxidoreductase subunit NuoG, partial [Bryobacterales bacterium]|nr:NADH-quinone oxidoreductase subunit NuoG [Bryobacterales bacterium]